MKLLFTTMAAVLAAVPALAQAPAAAPQQPVPAQTVEVSGSITSGVQTFDSNTNSAKFTEYRDLRDSFYLPRVTFALNDRATGWYFNMSAVNPTRADQTLLFDGGRPGEWHLRAHWVETPHNFSNEAQIPFIQRGPGLFTVPTTVPITFKKLATVAADAPGVLASDELIAQFQANTLRFTPLRTQNNTGHFGVGWSGNDFVALNVSWDRRTKSGLRSTYGPIGDRPPRTLNVQFTEPVDHRTNDLTFSAEHDGGPYQVRLQYQYSDFGNRIDTLEWQNLYVTPLAGSTYDVWDRAVSVFGRRPLPPDNRFHHVSATVGSTLPLNSRLTATAVYGRMEQNEGLLPYSFHVDRLADPTLPRATADAEMTVVQWLADYVVNPTRRLGLRAFVRHHGLDNNTPEAQWNYVTSDTSNLNGTVSFKNRRINLAYAADRTNAGIDATYRLPARSTLTFGYERENISRDYREADTRENRFIAAIRTRAARWANVRLRYLFGDRQADEYFNQVTQASYWYSLAQATDFDNPQFTFSNHPDMRRFDVVDRRRQQVDFTVNVTPAGMFAVSTFVRYRNDDFDGDVRPVQPLLGLNVADREARSPGDQLGFLDNARLRYGTDVFFQPTERITLNAFVNYDRGSAFLRSLEYNENNKMNPSAVQTAELGPWTRAGSQWTTDTRDRTWGIGGGGTVAIVPQRFLMTADYTVSLANVDYEYGGFGVTNWNGVEFPLNHQFAFRTPPTVREDLGMFNLRFEVPIRTVSLHVGYTYETYTLRDWQEGGEGFWVEPVGSEYLLRDTSRSHQWGNRLFNMGTYLAPSYNGHIGFVGFTYRF
jgi:MtrB/PioB family decaheme-associated outer membrane protein